MMLIQPALLVAVQLQSDAFALTLIEPVVAAEEAVMLVGVTVKLHVTPDCVTVKVCPAMVSVPVREALFGLAATV